MRSIPWAEQAAAGSTAELWTPIWNPVWSLDSRMVAVPTLRWQRLGESEQTQCYLVLLNSNGSFRVSIPIEEAAILNVAFSPDSKQIGLVTTSYQGDPPTDSDVYTATIYNTADAALVSTHYPGDTPSWLGQHSYASDYSPDRRRRVSCTNAGAVVLDVQTGQSTALSKAEIEFRRWVDNDLLLFSTVARVDDPTGDRTQTIRPLWLAWVGPKGGRSICVALDCDEDDEDGGGVTCSRNCTRVAYVCDDRLYCAELQWREPTPEEKKDAGQPLTEDDQKHLMMDNGKMIGVGLMMYALDHDGVYPGADTAMEDLKPYLRVEEFLRPGTDTMAFRFLAGGATQTEFDLDAPIGELDAGYGWKIVIYGDGHVREVPKK